MLNFHLLFSSGSSKFFFFLSQLYVKLYPEMLMRSRSVAVFVKAVWELVAGGKQLGIAYDQASGVCSSS